MGLLQDKLRDRERDLSDQLEQQKAILQAEKEKVESDLTAEMNRKIEEKDKELTTQLKAQRDRLENILQLKVDEQMRLQVTSFSIRFVKSVYYNIDVKEDNFFVIHLVSIDTQHAIS